MSSAYESTGRAAQKGRTRAALVASARALLASGLTPTVEDAAAAASVSRATAYRYFPSALSLLQAAHPEIDASTMLPAGTPDTPADRLDAVVNAFAEMIVRTEAQQRAMLRLSLEPNPIDRGPLPLRQGRAIAWIREAVDGSRTDLADDDVQLLVYAVRSCVGIEALVWLTDIAGLSRPEAVRLMRWSAQAMLAHALQTPPPSLGGQQASGDLGEP